MGIFGTLAGVAIVVLVKRNKKANERREMDAEVSENLRDIARIEGRREATRERIKAVDEQIAKVNGKLEDETRDLKTRQDAVKGMTTQEKVDRFRELGY